MIGINMTDVFKVLDSSKSYIIAFLVILIAGIVVTFAVRKKEKNTRKFIRKETWLFVLTALIVIVNMIMIYPMSTLLTLATTDSSLSDESIASAEELCEDIAEEGIVLLKNDNNALPLDGTKKLNLFGWTSVNPVYAGAGSGALSDVYDKVSLIEGLENSGYEVNEELVDFYNSYSEERPADWTLPEPPMAKYTDKMFENAKEYSDVAVLVLGRTGGEGADLPTDMGSIIAGDTLDSSGAQQNGYTNNSDEYNDFEVGEHYLQLSKTEEDLVNRVCSEFDNVVLLYNGQNAMELGWVEDYPQIQSILWMAGAGQTGFNALGEVLNGTVNPSGKTADTFVYDLTDTPTYNNFGAFFYDNMSEHDNAFYYYSYLISETKASFVDYVEGIYVGYRYYETAAEEGKIDYDSTVLYPFGYGLSYTTFEQEMGEMSVEGDTISFDVTVTNTGDAAGKDVVEVYYNPPYTNGGIEKSSANLISFDKTETLEPGESEVISVSFNIEDMASFDEYGEGCYVLEEGTYEISINTDSHNKIDTQEYVLDSTIVYDENNAKSTDNTAATTQFDYAAGEVTYLSRADGFANYDEATAAPTSYSMSDELKSQFISVVNYDAASEDNADDEMPTTGAKNGVKLEDLRGLDYDDELWEDLLDELTVDEMDNLISLAGYQTQAIDSIGKVTTTECDGPVAINNTFTGNATIGFPPEIVLANSWNTDLAHAYGVNMGVMAEEMGVNGWYAPGMNTHRSAFGGRNFEYYSEDGYLSGKLAAQTVAGAMEEGLYPFIKHFALNDQETNRLSMLCTWTNEQAVREIYLKPFEYAVKEGKTTAVMAGLNYIGPVAAGSSSSLLQTVLRDEWGFRGMVITDYFGMYGYQNADQQIRNGCDGCLVAYDVAEAHVTVQSATGVQAMRTAAHNILYTVVNSNAYADGANNALPVWKKTLFAVDAVLLVLLILAEVRVVRKYKMSKSMKIVDKRK